MIPFRQVVQGSASKSVANYIARLESVRPSCLTVPEITQPTSDTILLRCDACLTLTVTPTSQESTGPEGINVAIQSHLGGVPALKGTGANSVTSRSPVVYGPDSSSCR